MTATELWARHADAGGSGPTHPSLSLQRSGSASPTWKALVEASLTEHTGTPECAFVSDDVEAIIVYLSLDRATSRRCAEPAMLANLSLGTLLIATTVLEHTLVLIALSRSMPHLIRWGRLHVHGFGKATAMVMTVLGLFLAHTVEVWTWAAAYYGLGMMASFEDALYFSTTTFSTVGFGDLTLARDWRLLSSLEGVNGFLLIGWSTAYLVSASTRYGPFRAGEHF
jgi:hypothetical protein